MRKAAHPLGGVGHQIYTAGGVSGPTSMVMVYVR